MSNEEIKIVKSEIGKNGKPFPETPKPQIFHERFKIDSYGNKTICGDTLKNTKISISIVSLIIIAILIWFSLHNNIENKIIGSWNCNEISNLNITFLENKTLIINKAEFVINGIYSINDDNNIQLDFESYKLNSDVIIQGNKMVFNNISEHGDIIFVENNLTFIKTS